MIDVSDAELEVLKSLWRLEEASANEVITELNKQSQWHEKTVRTLLGRMVKKEAIAAEQQGRSYVYRPLVQQDDYTFKKSKSMLDKLFNGSLPSLVAGFAAKENLKKEEIDELKSFIAEWEKKHD